MHRARRLLCRSVAAVGERFDEAAEASSARPPTSWRSPRTSSSRPRSTRTRAASRVATTTWKSDFLTELSDEVDRYHV